MSYPIIFRSFQPPCRAHYCTTKTYLRLLLKETVVQNKIPEPSKGSQAAFPSPKDKRGKGKKKGSSNALGGHGKDRASFGKSYVDGELPDCLNKKFEKKHYVKDCDITNKEEAKRLLKDVFEARKNEKLTSARRVSDHSTESDAVFADLVSAKICANTGSDINLLQDTLVADFIGKKADVKAITFDKPRRFSVALEV